MTHIPKEDLKVNKEVTMELRDWVIFLVYVVTFLSSAVCVSRLFEKLNLSSGVEIICAILTFLIAYYTLKTASCKRCKDREIIEKELK